jgi:hypothetical protein
MKLCCGGLSGRDKDDIRAVYHRMLDLTRDSTSTDQDTELHE